MTPSDVLALAREEQQRALQIVAGLRPCPIVLSRATAQLGSFTVDRLTGDRVIRVSRHLADDAQVRDTARHELAHQAAWDLHGHLGHGPVWRMWARYIGCAPVACSAAGIDPDVVRSRERYAIECGSCGWRTTRQRRSKLVAKPWRFLCARCRGRLRVAELPGA